MENNYFLYLAIIIGLVVAFWYIRKTFKYPKTGALCLIDGGVKTGKSTFAVALTKRKFKAVKRRVKIANFFRKLLHKPLFEEPFIYSNIPLACDYVELTEELILRQKRFRYGSIIYINEASLLADSQLFRDMELNERLQLFNKLIGHETLGGCLIYDTQTIEDLHYSQKRCISEYFYIHHLTKWIPFFLVAYVRECRYSADSGVVTVDTADIEQSLVRVIIPKSTWKLFDAYAFSSLTDDLPVEDTITHGKDLPNLKIKKILSFRTFKTIDKEFLYEKKDS